MKLAVLFAVAALAMCVSADTPAHCEFEQILGTWELQLTAQDMDSTLVCNMPEMDVVDTFRFKLIAPNTVEAEDGSTGTFTIVYDEEIEVIVSGRRFWWQFEWESVSNPTGINSLCSQVHSTGGFVHEDQDSGVLPIAWGCFSGSLVDPTFPELSSRTFQAGRTAARMNEIPQQVMVDAINQANLGWKAKMYPEELLDTIRAGVSRQGRLPAFKLPPRVIDNSLPEGAPESFDWGDVDGENFLNPIRDQGRCGSCWAFAGAVAMSDRIRVATNNAEQPIISTQDLVSCCQFAEGCEGGWGYNLAKWGADYGIVEEECFPYSSGSGSTPDCSEKCTDGVSHIITGYEYIGGYYGACSVNGMIEDLLANGPLATSIMVYQDLFNWDPSSGPYLHDEAALNPVLRTMLNGADPVWEEANHLVVIVGYGVTEDGVEFWNVANSWGSTWGDHGFFQIVKGVGQVAFEHMAISFTV